MNKPIKTYEDLIQEQQRLGSILKNQEVLIREDLVGVQKGLEPLSKAMKVISQMATRDHTGPLTNFGLEFGLDLILRRFILAKAGWFITVSSAIETSQLIST